MKKVLNFAIIAAIVVALIAAVVGAMSLGIFLLWNWLAVDIFGAPSITFFQAAGLLLVAVVVRNFCARVNFKVTKG